MPRIKDKAAAPEVTELLHEDHKKVRDLFFKFSEAEAHAEKERLVNEILKELYVHSTAEEEVVYASLERAEDAKDLIDEAENEHRVVKFLMAELSNMTAKSDQFDAKVTVLAELINHHIEEEEKELFKKLSESGADLRALAKKTQARKNELKKAGLPQMTATLCMGDESLEEAEDAKSMRTAGGKRKASNTKQRKTA